jgi:hypothetical protein
MGEKRFIPYAEVSYVEVSGDSNTGDKENSNFVSLEGNSRTLVVENNYYGYNINTNYRGPRIAAGFNWGKFNFEVLYAYFELRTIAVAAWRAATPVLEDRRRDRPLLQLRVPRT